ncbi:hypothetical protein [Neobacillus soli]|uniref:hypothetical protein n=1 Tax=Neobacillus soli TaxID=220688 RepID=UPI000B059494|nr:hypothetical protein [Neobacillus soli]
MVIDPNDRANQLDAEWNSEEVQNEIISTGITRDEWEANRAADVYSDDHFDDVDVW